MFNRFFGIFSKDIGIDLGTANTYYVDLEAADSDGNNCSITKPVNIQELKPIWKEVNPGG